MSNLNNIDINSIGNLLRLQKVRIRSYEKKLEDDKKAYKDAYEKLCKRNEEISNIQRERNGIRGYVEQHVVSSSPVKREYAHTRRFWLNYDLEMHEYYLEGEKAALDEAKIQYESSKNIWLKEKLKSKKLNDEYRIANKMKDLSIENAYEEMSQEDHALIRK
jgi:hypothetical protein